MSLCTGSDDFGAVEKKDRGGMKRAATTKKYSLDSSTDEESDFDDYKPR